MLIHRRIINGADPMEYAVKRPAAPDEIASSARKI
jgi:hypothetical protein